MQFHTSLDTLSIIFITCHMCLVYATTNTLEFFKHDEKTR